MEKEIKKPFGTDTTKILEILTHRLYSDSEIFLKELISNGSDACNKINFLITSGDYKGENYQKKILINVNEEKNTLTIIDNGIGMDDDDMDNFLGTIASSNTRNTIEKLNTKTDLIGQFGIGFYSCFMVADEVQVWSKKYNTNESFLWKSNGKDAYEIISQNNPFYEINESHGTQVQLILKEDFKYLTNKYQIIEIIKKYSSYVNVPIKFYDEQDKNETINKLEIPWRSNTITPEIAHDIYRQVLNRQGEVFKYIHQKLQGKYDYTRLIYIPAKSYFGEDRMGSFKIYLNGVFVSNELEFLPRYMRFASGLVEFQDMPINISRENFLQNPFVEQVKNSIKIKILEELIKNIDNNRQEYIDNFWNYHGNFLKSGLMEEYMDKTMVFDCCLFKSNKKKSLITIREYIKDLEETKVIVEDFKEESDKKVIYYAPCTNEVNPLADSFVKERNIDVLMVDGVFDKMILEFANNYQDYSLVNILDQQKIYENNDEDKKFLEECKNILKDVTSINFNTLEENILGYQTTDINFGNFNEKPMVHLVLNINHPLIKKIKEKNDIKDDIIAVNLFIKSKELAGDNGYVVDNMIDMYLKNIK